MITLVERLRLGGPNAYEVYNEAADEIERLRKENWEFVARAYALIHMLPDETMAGEIQEARRVFGGVVDTLKAENERLREALRPFAYYASLIPDDISDTCSASGTVANLRAALKALGENELVIEISVINDL